jgi:type II secretory pathway component PulF
MKRESRSRTACSWFLRSVREIGRSHLYRTNEIMPEFAYVARSVAGQRVEGVLSAGTEREAIASLNTQQLFPMEVKAASGHVQRIAGQRVRPQAMAQFYLQMAALLRSGVPLLRSLEVIGNQTTNQALQRTIEDLHARVTDGESLAEAMKRHPKAFDELSTSIVRAGGEGGFLEEALERVAKFTDQQADLRSRVMGALAYPIFLTVFSIAIVSVLVIFFVPKFEVLFGRLRARGELPFLTDWLLWLSNAISNYGLLIALALVIVVLLVRARLTPSRADGFWTVGG